MIPERRETSELSLELAQITTWRKCSPWSRRGNSAGDQWSLNWKHGCGSDGNQRWLEITGHGEDSNAQGELRRSANKVSS